MTEKKTAKTAVKQYEVLIPCSNESNNWDVGDTVTNKDLSTAVIKNWCEIIPPVLKEKVN